MTVDCGVCGGIHNCYETNSSTGGLNGGGDIGGGAVVLFVFLFLVRVRLECKLKHCYTFVKLMGDGIHIHIIIALVPRIDDGRFRPLVFSLSLGMRPLCVCSSIACLLARSKCVQVTVSFSKAATVNNKTTKSIEHSQKHFSFISVYHSLCILVGMFDEQLNLETSIIALSFSTTFARAHWW